MKRVKRPSLSVFLLILSLVSSPIVSGYDITCENHICEISNAHDIGVGWGVIAEWERPAWSMYLSEMTNIQLRYQRCAKFADQRYEVNMADAKNDFDTCSLAALASAVGCVATCKNGFKAKLVSCVKVCTVEWGVAKAFCANEWLIDRTGARSKKETDYSICSSERAGDRGQAASDRDEQLAQLRP